MDWTHCGIYVGDSTLVEAVTRGVVVSDVSEWDYPSRVAVRAVRYLDASLAARQLACEFALEQVGRPYDFNYFTKSTDPHGGMGWYCSELVWAAYTEAGKSLGEILNLDRDAGPVTPDELAGMGDSASGQVVGEHIEQWKLPTIESAALAFLVMSPVDVIVVDPDGLSVSRAENEIPGAAYLEEDLDQDGHVRTIISLPEKKEGEYSITPVRRTGATPNAIYSIMALDYETGRTRAIAERTAIRDLPSTPYRFSPIFGTSVLIPALAGGAGGLVAMLLSGAAWWFLRRRSKQRTIRLS